MSLHSAIEDLTVDEVPTTDDYQLQDDYATEEKTPRHLFDEEEISDPTFIRSEAEPDKKLVAGDRRKSGALKYEKKARQVFRDAAMITVANPKTQSDFAAIIIHGPQAARAIGDLAAIDPRVARGVDMLSEGSTNPYVACALACAPLALQIVRNHEEQEISTPTGIKIPFIKKTIPLPKLRWKFKLAPKLRAMFTQDKEEIARKVFSDPAIIEALKSRGFVISD